MELIVAKATNGVIGKDNLLPWRLPKELKWFKEKTLNKPVIMGRKTYESLPKTLPGRLNVVVTRDSAYEPEDDSVIVVNDPITALTLFQHSGIVIGGGEIYALFLPFVTRMYVTEVDVLVDGDAFFPDTSIYQWNKTYEERAVENGIRYKKCIYERIYVPLERR